MSREHIAEAVMHAHRSPAGRGTPAGQQASEPALKQTNLRRRGFLLALGVGGAGAAAVAIQSRSVGAIAADGASDVAADGSGYQLTEHVRRYYQTTKT